MITYQEALKLVLGSCRKFPAEYIPLEQSMGRTLAVPVYADRDYPPFNRSAMDGYAIRSTDILEGNTFLIIQAIYPGSKNSLPYLPKSCFKIMTGAPVPPETDAVIRIEDTELTENPKMVRIKCDVKAGMNIAMQGENHTKDDLIFKEGTAISTGVLSTLAALGKKIVSVFIAPRVAVISTGNEIRSTSDEIGPYEIRDSNSYSIYGFLSHYKIGVCKKLLIKDDKNALIQAIKEVINYDLIFVSGGVSMGDADFIPEALKEAEVEKIFHKTAIKPGKPMWFGKTSKECAVFALPGNPFSVQVLLKIYVEPYLRKCFSINQKDPWILPLGNNKHKKTHFDEFFPCTLTHSGGSSKVSSMVFNGSGDISVMCGSDGIALHPADTIELKENDRVLFFPWTGTI